MMKVLRTIGNVFKTIGKGIWTLLKGIGKVFMTIFKAVAKVIKVIAKPIGKVLWTILKAVGKVLWAILKPIGRVLLKLYRLLERIPLIGRLFKAIENLVVKIKDGLKGVVVEAKKVSWLKKGDLALNTGTVLLFCLVLGLYFYASDAIIAVILRALGLS